MLQYCIGVFLDALVTGNIAESMRFLLTSNYKVDHHKSGEDVLACYGVGFMCNVI